MLNQRAVSKNEHPSPATVVGGEYAFQPGQLVSHRDQPMLAMVVGRQKAGPHEIYNVTRLADDCAVPELLIIGDVLVAVADEDAEAVASAEANWMRAA